MIFVREHRFKNWNFNKPHSKTWLTLRSSFWAPSNPQTCRKMLKQLSLFKRMTFTWLTRRIDEPKKAFPLFTFPPLWLTFALHCKTSQATPKPFVEKALCSTALRNKQKNPGPLPDQAPAEETERALSSFSFSFLNFKTACHGYAQQFHWLRNSEKQ